MVSPMEMRDADDAAWNPKPGDKARYLGDIEVTIVRRWHEDQWANAQDPEVRERYENTYEVRYAREDNFGERASFAAHRLELTPR